MVKLSDLTTCTHHFASITIDIKTFFNDNLETNYISNQIDLCNNGKVLALICEAKDLFKLLETSKIPSKGPVELLETSKKPSGIPDVKIALLFRDAGMDHNEYDYFIIDPLNSETNLGSYWDKAQYTRKAWCRFRMDMSGSGYSYYSENIKEFYNRFSFVKKEELLTIIPD